MRRWGIAGALAVAVLAVAPGCGPSFEEVLIAGHDAEGTPVVGAVDCTFDDRVPAEVISVSAAVGSRPAQEVWRIERPGTGRMVPEGGGPPSPPPPTPRSIGGVEMVAIGDREPPGGDVAVALSEPLSDDVLVEAFVVPGDLSPIGEVLLESSGAPDTYDLDFRQADDAVGLDAAEAAARIDQECDNEGVGFAVAPVLITTVITLGVLVLLAVLVGMATARQYRRAAATAKNRT
ncbi:MAG TPA: hypothetical protein VF228_04645 [Iamia sp.]